MTSYVGISPKNPTKYVGPGVAIVSIVVRNRAPTGADIRQGSTGKYYPIGSFWIISKNPTTGQEGNLFWLSKIVANVATWIQIGNGTAILEIDTADGSASPLAGILDFIDGTGMQLSATGNSVTFNSTGGGLTWSVVTVDTPMAVNNGYIVNNSGGLTLTLPATSAIGDMVRICGMTGLWTLACNTGQTMYFGDINATMSTGTFVATNAGDCVELVCMSVNTTWRVLSSVGNPTIT